MQYYVLSCTYVRMYGVRSKCMLVTGSEFAESFFFMFLFFLAHWIENLGLVDDVF